MNVTREFVDWAHLVCRDAVQTGLFSARLKRRKLDIERVELLASIRGDSPETAYTAVIEPTGKLQRRDCPSLINPHDALLFYIL